MESPTRASEGAVQAGESAGDLQFAFLIGW